MDGWIKYFADGTILQGCDEDVARRLASWSKSRLDGLVRVDLRWRGKTISIRGTGEFWQADVFETSLWNTESKMVVRILKKKLHAEDTHMYIDTSERGMICSFQSGTPLYQMGDAKLERLGSGLIDRWFVMELEDGKVNWRIE